MNTNSLEPYTNTTVTFYREKLIRLCTSVVSSQWVVMQLPVTFEKNRNSDLLEKKNYIIVFRMIQNTGFKN